MVRYLFYTGFICFFMLQASAGDPVFQRLDYIPVIEESRPLRFPWAGGLNSALFGMADMNNDGHHDLVVYDKTNNRFLVFKNPNLVNSTAYELDTSIYHFPVADGWFLLKDYNCDGIEDFFTYSGDGSIMVYKGFYSGGKLNFTLQQKGFYFQGFTGDVNVYNVIVDKPALLDMNNDGDLDVVTFGVSGTRIIYYENQRVELALPCDSLYFKIGDNCWGNIFEDGVSPLLTLRDTCSVKFPRLAGNENTLHVGSTLEVADINGDGKLDALLGDVSLNNFNYLRNEGSISYASFLQQDTTFPAYDVPLRINYFPVPYDAVSGANIHSIWFYKNVSSDSFRLQLQQKDFLVSDMIEAGEGSHPSFFDYNNDGLQDIILGTNGYKDLVNDPLYKWKLYKNSGSAGYPNFTLENGNYLNIDSLQLKEAAPASGDLDNDGDIDIIAGLIDGKLVWWENTAGNGNVPVLIYRSFVKNDTGQVFSVGGNAMPAIADLDNDNKNDLVIGERNGNLNYYKGFSASPLQFKYSTDSLGKIRIVAPFTTLGYTAPSFADLDTNGKPDLILGNYTAGLLWYKDIKDKLAGSFGVPDTLFSRHLGYRTTPVFADLSNDDKPELVVGTLTGGLQLFSLAPPPFQPVGVIYNALPKLDFLIFPNPSDDRLYISIKGQHRSLRLEMYNILGKLEKINTNDFQDQIFINTNGLANGMYLLKLSDGEREGVQKVIIQHK
jgi:Secretion system C-terminal sorting domain/FG-GAP-like repeat